MMQESLDLAEQSNCDQAFFAKLYPFPGTEIKKICESEQTISDELNFEDNGMPSVSKTKFISDIQLKNFAKKISNWQFKRYINEGFKLKNIFFIIDIILFLLYRKRKYDLEFNQIYRWNVQRYKENHALQGFSVSV